MVAEQSEELVAYSVQHLGAVWWWRVHDARGRAAFEGAELSEDDAWAAAAALFWSAVETEIRRQPSPRQPGPRRLHLLSFDPERRAPAWSPAWRT
jgi:hypothetical protein